MKKWTLILLVSSMTVSFLVVPVAAKMIRTEYEGVSTCGPVIGGRDWISKGGVSHLRGGSLACTDVVNDERINGDELLTVNYNFKSAVPPVFIYGPMWGKARISNENGYWEGSWVGERTKEDGYSYIRAVLRGYGDYEGLQARVDYIRESPDPAAPYQVYGVIMETGGH